MVERSPSGLYTSVFSVLYYCGESFFPVFSKSLSHKKDGVQVVTRGIERPADSQPDSTARPLCGVVMVTVSLEVLQRGVSAF